MSRAQNPLARMGHSKDERRLNALAPASLPAVASNSILDRVPGEDEHQRRERLMASVRITKEDVRAALAASRAGDRSLVAELQRRSNAPVPLLLAPRCTAFVKHLGRTCRNVAVRDKDLCYHHLALAEMAAESRKCAPNGRTHRKWNF